MASVTDCAKRLLSSQWSESSISLVCALSGLRTLRGCATKAASARLLALAVYLPVGSPLAGQAQPATIDYQRDIQPLFDRYCVACHACFDAPCQLDLTLPDGLARGASKQPVYDGTRLEAAQPTRLFIDARSSAAHEGHVGSAAELILQGRDGGGRLVDVSNASIDLYPLRRRFSIGQRASALLCERDTALTSIPMRRSLNAPPASNASSTPLRRGTAR